MSWMMELGNGTAMDMRLVIVSVLKYHTGTPWNTIGEPAWKCNCCWEGDDWPEHVADIIEASVEAYKNEAAANPLPMGEDRWHILKMSLIIAAQDCEARGHDKGVLDRFIGAAAVCDRAGQPPTPPQRQ